MPQFRIRYEKPVLLLGGLAIVILLFHTFLLHADTMILNTEGDAAKNYFTYLYHSLYGSGLWFKGMNYPYGEHVLYPDLQPALSALFIILRENYGWGYAHALALMHGSMLAGLALALYFNVRILRYLQIPLFWSVAFGICITFLSPQMLRFSGHFALAYPCFTAMLFYYTLRYHREGAKVYAIYMALLCMVLFFFHPYYVAMAMVWVLCYALVYLLGQSPAFSTSIRHLLPLCMVILVPVLLARLFTGMTDPVTDRPDYPYGAMAYATTGDHLFSSAYSPAGRILQALHIVREPCTGGEGYGYPGLVSIGILAFVLLRFIILKIRRKPVVPISVPGGVGSGQWLGMSVLLLLAAMGVPFVWGMESLLDYVSVFRQFRSLGRFIWMFYQLISVFSIVFLFQWYTREQAKGKKRLLLILWLPLLIWSAEAFGYVTHINRMAETGRKNYQAFYTESKARWQDLMQKKDLRTDQFQAIIALPYVHVGSDKWSCNGASIGDLTAVYAASLSTRLPVVDVMMARTSWSQTAAQVRISGGIYAHAPLWDTSDKRPFLLLKSRQSILHPDEDWLLQLSAYLGDIGETEVRLLDPVKIRTARSTALAEVRRIAVQMSGQDTVLYAEGEELLFRDHTDAGAFAPSFFGKGALPAIRSRDSLVLSLPLNPSSGEQMYEISTWVLMSEKDYRTPVLNLSLLDGQGNEIYRRDAVGKESFDNRGMWFRVQQYFSLPAESRVLRWHVYNDACKSYLALDEIQIRPVHALLISKTKEGLLVNNHWIE